MMWYNLIDVYFTLHATWLYLCFCLLYIVPLDFLLLQNWSSSGFAIWGWTTNSLIKSLESLFLRPEIIHLSKNKNNNIIIVFIVIIVQAGFVCSWHNSQFIGDHLWILYLLSPCTGSCPWGMQQKHKENEWFERR